MQLIIPILPSSMLLWYRWSYGLVSYIFYLNTHRQDTFMRSKCGTPSSFFDHYKWLNSYDIRERSSYIYLNRWKQLRIFSNLPSRLFSFSVFCLLTFFLSFDIALSTDLFIYPHVGMGWLIKLTTSTQESNQAVAIRIPYKIKPYDRLIL